MRFVAPITLVGCTALSVDIITMRCTLYLPQSSAKFHVPYEFTLRDSLGLSSIKGTCL